ncbi:hypothetical protein [uncultured Mediterranean phage uvDeep-CGR2-KM21-C88]|nr:hypothetical protein [uncultured Mediterranean phage uvDeep-CGR2-KM21-C88]
MQIKEHGIVAELKLARSRIKELERDLDEFNQLSQELIDMHESLNAKANHAGSLARSVLAESEAEDHLDVGEALDVIEQVAELCDQRAVMIDTSIAYHTTKNQ